MIFIPGFVIAFLTFPGVIVHEAAHQLFCRWMGLAVFDVCYFDYNGKHSGRLGSGFVSHERTDRFGASFLVTTGPLFVNSILCVLICLPALVPMRLFNHTDIFTLFLMWVGLSIGMHAFPSFGDAKNLQQACRDAMKRKNIFAIFVYPLVGIIYLFNIGRILWLDFIYGAAIGLGLPILVLTWVLKN